MKIVQHLVVNYAKLCKPLCTLEARDMQHSIWDNLNVLFNLDCWKDDKSRGEFMFVFLSAYLKTSTFELMYKNDRTATTTKESIAGCITVFNEYKLFNHYWPREVSFVLTLPLHLVHNRVCVFATQVRLNVSTNPFNNQE